MAVYGILGGGTCPKNIIEDGLLEIGIEGNTFIVVGTKKPSPSEERVYDFLIDNEANYEVVTIPGVSAPRVLLDGASETNSINSVLTDFIDMIVDRDGMLLLMWDESQEGLMSDIATVAYDNKVLVKELSNGLAPIAVQDEPATFTKEEVESMPPAVQKRSTTSNPTTTITDLKITTPERPQIVAPDGDCMVTVVMPNGTVISTPATIEEVRVLLGLSGGS